MTGELRDEAALRTVYHEPPKAVREKSFPHLDKHNSHYLDLCSFFCIGSSRSNGLTDVSPRGVEPGFVHVIDDTHENSASRRSRGTMAKGVTITRLRLRASSCAVLVTSDCNPPMSLATRD